MVAGGEGIDGCPKGEEGGGEGVTIRKAMTDGGSSVSGVNALRTPVKVGKISSFHSSSSSSPVLLLAPLVHSLHLFV
ncbi:hypothetical protein E2C01_059923 [Portunus trituberculatus]|uniref:Uncharacterized protein n=1 Tax=Portunus trituberculatus TaxID=210409 RepID=A0A5B7H932_PORTR|nr:hypothetical protein [Portunus trituberculatus]